MRSVSRTCIVLLVASSLSVFSGPANAAKEAADDRPRKTEIEVERWLVLGPAPYFPPVFHDAEKGGYDLEDLIASTPLPIDTLKPAQGASVGWFSGESLRWTARAAGRRGRLELDADLADEAPAIAWLAIYIRARSWVELELRLLGRHPRRAWLDGEPLVDGGKDEDDEVEEEVELTPGSHLLLVQTVRDPTRDARWFAGARLSAEHASAGVEVFTAPERDVELRDVLDAPRITSLAVAPDGLRVATSFDRTIPGDDDTETWIEIRDTATGKLVRGWPEDERSGNVGWSPDGKYVSYVADVDDDSSSLFLFDTATAKAEPLLHEVKGLTGYLWSPTGRVIAYSTTVKAEKDERGIKRLEGLLDRQSGYRDKQVLRLVTVPDGVRRRLTAGELTSVARAFSPDGDKLLFSREVEDLTERPYTRTELWEAEIATVAATKLRDFRWLNDVTYAPHGERLLVSTQPQEFGDSGLDLPRDIVPNSYDSQLYIWNPATDEVDPITRDFDPAVSGMIWSRQDGRIYVTAVDRDFERVFRYEHERRSWTTLGTGFEVVGNLALARGAPTAVAVGSSAWSPEGLFALDLRSGAARPLAHPADSWFESVGRGTVEPWSFTASNGRTIDGRLYLPPDFDAGKKYPAIVYYYGGVSPVDRGFGGRYPKEWWASRGYVVYVLQPSGAFGYGQAHSAAHVNDWGKTSSEEIIEGTRKLLASHPYIDPERVGCIGASYGGFMTMLLVTKTDLYAAAVAHAGISSISSYWGEGYWGYSYNSTAAADSFPWNREDLYVGQSPLFRADRARVPILLTHGRADTNVPVGESDAFYVALKLLGKQVEYVQIKGQDHWILDRDKREVWSSTILAWFDRWLKDEPAWWNELYSVTETE